MMSVTRNLFSTLQGLWLPIVWTQKRQRSGVRAIPMDLHRVVGKTGHFIVFLNAQYFGRRTPILEKFPPAIHGNVSQCFSGPGSSTSNSFGDGAYRVPSPRVAGDSSPRNGAHVRWKTSIRNDALNCSPGAITRSPLPELNAFVSAVIGSIAMNSLSFGAKICANGNPVSNSIAMEEPPPSIENLACSLESANPSS